MLDLGQNYLNWYFRLLTIIGMWNPFDELGAKRRLYTLYATALFCIVGMTPCTGEIIHAWKSNNDIVIFTQHFSLFTGMVSTMAKIVNLWHCRPDIQIATDLLNWERQQPCNRKFAVYRDEIITSTMRACRVFSLTFIIMVFWYCSFSYGKDLVYHKGDMNKLSIRIIAGEIIYFPGLQSPLFSFRSNASSAYWLMFAVDKTTISYLASCTACHDSFFMVFLIHVSAQLDLLKRRLEFCQDKIGGRFYGDYSGENYEMYDLKVESVCRTTMQEILLDPIIELHMCIKHHQKILRYVNLVQSIFNITLVLQFGTSLLIITMTGFQLFGERQLNHNEIIDTVNFLICAIFQLFLYCWFGTDIIAKSESISLSAYNSKWYVADRRFKKTLSILLCRGQIPIVFRAGAICELSSTTFMNIISKCYSSMTLLKQVNE